MSTQQPALAHPPFKGVTTDGTVKTGLYGIYDDESPINQIVVAGQALISALHNEERRSLLYHIDAPDWHWCICMPDCDSTVRLERPGVMIGSLSRKSREDVFRFLQAAVSFDGYARIQAFVGLNGNSDGDEYRLALFGEPSETEPWGFSFYGPHLSVNIFLYQTSILSAPLFLSTHTTGSLAVLGEETRLSLQVIHSLSPSDRAKATLHPTLGPGRSGGSGGGSILGSVYLDNAVIPYEGVIVSELPIRQRVLVMDIIYRYLTFLPQRGSQNFLGYVAPRLHETYFGWIGPPGQSGLLPDLDNGASHYLYFRIQSPTILIEFERVPGAHTRTVFRVPNGGDYGFALRSLIESS